MRTYTGTLTAHGSAPYQHKPENNMSYFVELENNGVKSEIWGLELEKALQKTSAKIGDNVVVNNLGSKETAIPDPKDPTKSKTIKRNEWEVETQEPYQQFENAIEYDEREQFKEVEKTKEDEILETEPNKKINPAELDNLPDSVKNNYIGIVKNRSLKNEKINYYDKSDPSQINIAFEDRKNSLNTSRQDEQTVQAMIALAESKGWTAIKLKGTEEFKQKAWVEASLRGIETSGYEPSEKAKAELLAKQQARTVNNVEATAIKQPEKSEYLTVKETIDIAKTEEKSAQISEYEQKSHEVEHIDEAPRLAGITVQWTEKHGNINQDFNDFRQLQAWYQQQFPVEYIQNNPNSYDKSMITVHGENVPDELTQVDYPISVGMDFVNPNEQDIQEMYVDFYKDDFERFGVDIQQMTDNYYEIEAQKVYENEEITAENFSPQPLNDLEQPQIEPVYENIENNEISQDIDLQKFSFVEITADEYEISETEKVRNAVHIRDNETGENYIVGTYSTEYENQQIIGVIADYYETDLDFQQKNGLYDYQEQIFDKLGIQTEAKDIVAFIDGDKELSTDELDKVLSKENLQAIIKSEPNLDKEMQIAYESAEKADFDKQQLSYMAMAMLSEKNIAWSRKDEIERNDTILEATYDVLSLDEKKYNQFIDNLSQATHKNYSDMKIDVVEKTEKEVKAEVRELAQNGYKDGSISNRDDLVQALVERGYEVTEKADDAIRLKIPNSDKNLTLKGEMFTKDFDVVKDLIAKLEPEAIKEQYPQISDKGIAQITAWKDHILDKYQTPQAKQEILHRLSDSLKDVANGKDLGMPKIPANQVQPDISVRIPDSGERSRQR